MNILTTIIGLAFFAFLPGYLLVRLVFKDQEPLEQLLLSVIFSIMIAMTIGIFFGYDRAQAARTGGFTTKNIWMGEIIITALLGTIHIIKYTLQQRKEDKTEKNRKERKPTTKTVKQKKTISENKNVARKKTTKI